MRFFIIIILSSYENMKRASAFGIGQNSLWNITNHKAEFCFFAFSVLREKNTDCQWDIDLSIGFIHCYYITLFCELQYKLRIFLIFLGKSVQILLTNNP